MCFEINNEIRRICMCFEIILRRYNQSITYHPLVTNDQSEPICIQ
jgi:hypothetical protein